MTKLFVIYLLVICPFIKMTKTRDDTNIKETFIDWNKATISSLKSKIRLPNPEGSIYRNRLGSFKALVEIVDQSEVNPHSIRYQFLKEISLKMNGKKEFYVVEANRSGESIELINYVIEVYNNGVWAVDIYIHNNKKWLKKGTTRKVKTNSNSNLNNISTKFGLGFNGNDIIVTKFLKKSVIKSDYYLYGTLSSNSIKKVLSLDRR